MTPNPPPWWLFPLLLIFAMTVEAVVSTQFWLGPHVTISCASNFTAEFKTANGAVIVTCVK